MSVNFFVEVPMKNTILSASAWFRLRWAAPSIENPSRRDPRETRLGTSEPSAISFRVCHSRFCLGQRAVMTGGEALGLRIAEGLHEGMEQAYPGDGHDAYRPGSGSARNYVLACP